MRDNGAFRLLCYSDALLDLVETRGRIGILGMAMAETTSRLSEIAGLLRQLSAEKRAIVLKAITELFVEGANRYKPAQVTLFDSLFNELIVGTDTETLATLSRHLAPVINGPKTLIGQLALSDDITVAEPVLVRSPCVENSVLIDVARTKSQTHLLAIACRSELASEIVDPLIARGDEVTVRYVANNKGAQISEAGAITLVQRAKTDDTLAELLANRRDEMPCQRGTVMGDAQKTPPVAPAAA